jgi:hypothetical protein
MTAMSLTLAVTLSEKGVGYLDAFSMIASWSVLLLGGRPVRLAD